MCVAGVAYTVYQHGLILSIDSKFLGCTIIWVLVLKHKTGGGGTLALTKSLESIFTWFSYVFLSSSSDFNNLLYAFFNFFRI